MTQNIYSTDGRDTIAVSSYASEALAHRRATSPLFFECMWIDGELVSAEEAIVRNQPGIFEDIRCYRTARGPAIFRLEDHLQRFLQAARTLATGDLRYSLLELRRAVHVTVHFNNLSACTVRPIVYIDRQPGSDVYPTVAVVTSPFDTSGHKQRQAQGLRLMTTTVEQTGPDRALTRDALPQRAARTSAARAAARRRGFDEAVLLGSDGAVIDCTGDPLFVVQDNTVFAPPAANRDDVARDTALTLLLDLNYRVVEQPVSREQLYQADEIFVCGTASEIVPVRQLDSRQFDYGDEGKGQAGLVTRDLQRLYAQTSSGEGRRSRGWLEYVMMEPLF